MSDAQMILTILAVLCLTWQISLVVMGNAMLRSGRYTNVKIGCLPIALTAIFGIWAVLL